MQFADKATFVAYMNQGQPSRPANVVNIVAINQGQRPLTMDEPYAPALSVNEVFDLINLGGVVVDTRSEAGFGAGHIPGAYNIQLISPEFEQRIGWIVPQDMSMILVMENEADIQRALRAMAFVGLDSQVKGYLAGGIKAWINRGLSIKTLPQISVQQLSQQLEADPTWQVLDVRDPSEWDAGHIASAHHMSYKVIRQRLKELQITPDKPVSVLCAGGMRSSTACSILLMNGYNQVSNVTGGMSAWEAACLPIVDAYGQPIDPS